MSKTHSVLGSFSHTIDGVKTALKNEPNLRIHFIAAIATLVFGYYLKLTTLEFAVVILAIGFVIALELINTSLEALVDIVSPEIRELAKNAKDVAGASVLIGSLSAAGVAAFVFVPRIMQLL